MLLIPASSFQREDALVKAFFLDVYLWVEKHTISGGERIWECVQESQNSSAMIAWAEFWSWYNNKNC